ncbi:MAG: hypothetical protein Q4B26_11270 [Eubacteriales bacterium]|nr:hypothetical protein [Eubacteriales bacterium]
MKTIAPEGNKKQKTKSDYKAGTKGYLVIMWFMIFMTVNALAMYLAISDVAQDPAYLSLAIPPGITALLMVIYRIRYRIIFHMMPDVSGWCRASGKRIRGFLFPVHTAISVDREENTEFQKEINDFLNEYEDVYAGGSGTQSMTQVYRHMVLMHKKRLDRLGLQRKSRYTRLKFQGKNSAGISARRDGNFKSTYAEEYRKWTTRYYKDNKEVYRKKFLGIIGYDTIGPVFDYADPERKRVICAGCGAMSRVGELLDGCPYCGRTFILEELKNRVANLNFSEDPVLITTRAGKRITGVINWITVAAALINTVVFSIEFFPIALKEMKTVPFAILIGTCSVILLFAGALLVGHFVLLPLRIFIFYLYRKRREARKEEIKTAEENKQMYNRTIHRKNPDFSMQLLFSNIRNKLQGIHFADGDDNLSAFVSGAIRRDIPVYQNVADCYVHQLQLKNYELTGSDEVVTVECELFLQKWTGSRMIEEREQIELVLRKKKERDMKSPFGIYSPRCAVCGAPVDILKGNQCSWCGNYLDPSKLDWCITDYKVI